MPEGDTVWLVARHLDQVLAGRTLARGELRVPQLAGTDLAGRGVIEVRPRGKHLLTRLDDGTTLHSHLRLDGMWHLYRHRSRWTGDPVHAVRAVLSTDEWDVVGYRVHDLALVPTAQEADLVGHLGPDLLDPAFDRAEALRRLALGPDREVGVALLDQTCLAGIGTVYRDETLFLERTSPFTQVGRVGDLGRVVDRARTLLEANKEHASQATTGDRRRGHEHWVHGRAGRPCRRCGTALRSAQQGPPTRERTTTWCPRCQPAPGLG